VLRQGGARGSAAEPQEGACCAGPRACHVGAGSHGIDREEERKKGKRKKKKKKKGKKGIRKKKKGKREGKEEGKIGKILRKTRKN
jgi:hypothetical protein